MGPTDYPTSLGEHPEVMAAADDGAGPVGRTRPGDERRVLEDRRVRYDRREMIRFEDDRRTGFDRRMDGDPWAMRQ